MGSKSQRRKERHSQRRKEKRKQQDKLRGQQPVVVRRVEIVVGSNARHRERLSQQIPKAWAGELPEDTAVFDDSALSLLSPELAPQATAVREALQHVLQSRPDDAVKSVTVIPRSSPFSEWRLFIRGLIDWMEGEKATAGEVWQRLDFERRPGRIAKSMMVALRPDLEQVAPQAGPLPRIEPPPQNEPGTNVAVSPWDYFDEQQLYHAKLLHRVRFDRAALQVAEAGVKTPEESKDLIIGPRKIQWLKRFIAEYGDTEPELATALAQTALGQAFCQDYSNLFDDAIQAFEGPRHDPRNRLLTYFYYWKFNEDPTAEKRSENALKEYLKSDLPRNASLPVPLRNAIASEIHLNEALALMVSSRGRMPFAFLFEPQEDSKAIRSHFLAAVKAAPANDRAYKAHILWLNSKLDEDRLRKEERTRVEQELAAVMVSWSRGMPDETEPRLWLVDHFLENEQLEEARPHVEFLSAVRHDNPRVRATPWKWQILEAMRLCRRKAWLADVPARLNDAEALWPAWLSKQWLPYLRAAWTLRSGRLEEFEKQREQICAEAGRVRNSLADACMMLGAAQRMRVSATDLKPLRAALDEALKALNSLPLDDLLETSSFFWDLHRTQLIYPAYRMHSKAIGKELFGRLEKDVNLTLNRIGEERIHHAVLWGAEHRFWSSVYERTWPSFYSNPVIQQHPMLIAAKLHASLKQTYLWGADKLKGLSTRLREASQLQRDPYYRYWFGELADQFDDAVELEANRFSSFGFGGGFSSSDDEDDLGFDTGCNCPDCQAARKAANNSSFE